MNTCAYPCSLLVSPWWCSPAHWIFSMLCGSSAAQLSHWLVGVSLNTPHCLLLCGSVLCSVPVLMLVVPPVEIDVKCHDTARGHACDQSPEEQQNHEKKVQKSIKFTALKCRIIENHNFHYFGCFVIFLFISFLNLRLGLTMHIKCDILIHYFT